MTDDQGVTERVVLKEIPAGDLEEGRNGWELMTRPDGTTPIIFRAATATAAEKQAAQDNPGRYKAIPFRSWKGGTEIVLPDKPKPESRLFE